MERALDARWLHFLLAAGVQSKGPLAIIKSSSYGCSNLVTVLSGSFLFFSPCRSGVSPVESHGRHGSDSLATLSEWLNTRVGQPQQVDTGRVKLGRLLYSGAIPVSTSSFDLFIFTLSFRPRLTPRDDTIPLARLVKLFPLFVRSLSIFIYSLALSELYRLAVDCRARARFL